MKTSTYKIFNKVIFVAFVFILIFSWSISDLTKIPSVIAATHSDTFTSAGTSSWVAPANVNSITVEAWGAGGGGSTRSSGTNVCGGGAGAGAYAASTISVTPLTSYSYTVGAGGTAGNNGGNSSFNTSSVIAVGGNGVANNITTGGAGGLASSSTGNTKYDGGSGDTCSGSGGGGGGSGGTGSAGNTATSSTGASAVVGGGPGGNGGTVTSAYGQSPSSGPGGGGGGAYRLFATRTGGTGYAGQVRITYTLLTTLGDGTDQGNSSIAPGASATEIDRFSFATNADTDTVTGLTVTLGPTGAYNYIGTISVQTTGGTTKCSTSSITSNTVTLTSCAISATTSSTEYKIMVTPKTHVNMPSPPGDSPAITATVTGWTGTNGHLGADTDSATITIDNSSPDYVTGATAAAGNQQVALSWTNPTNTDFTTGGKVVVLRRASTDVSDTPVEGTSYSVGNTVGSSTVACVNSGSPPSTSCTSSSLIAGTPYYFKIFTQDSNGNFSASGVSPTGSPATPTGPTTLSTSIDPASATVAPGSEIRSVGQFTYTSGNTSDTITSLTLTLAGSPTGSYTAINNISIRSGSCAGTLYFSAVTPSSDSVNFSGGTALPVSPSGNTYLICVTPKDHTLAAGTYGVSPYVSSTWTSGNGYDRAGTDTNANTLTIDNGSPNSATSTSGSPGSSRVFLNWTTSSSSDFNTTSGSVIYRWLGSSAGSEVPTEGSTPSVGDTNSTATVACVISSSSSTALNKTDGAGGSSGCTTTALTNDQSYTYKVFQKDFYGNYDAGVTMGTFTPVYSQPSCSSQASGNWSAGETWSAGCSGTNGIPIEGDIVTITAGTTVTVDSSQAASNVTINNSGTLSFASSSTLTLNGTTGTLLTNNGSFYGGSSSTVVVASPTSPTAILAGSFTASPFYNLTLAPTISGNVDYVMGAAFTAMGNFTIDPTSSGSNTLTVTLGGTTAVFGSVSITAESSGVSVLDTGNNQMIATSSINIGAGGTLEANNSIILITQYSETPTLVVTGTFNAGASTVMFDGQDTFSLSMIDGNITFNNLQLTSLAYVVLMSPITISGNLSITNSYLFDNGNQITGNSTGTLTLEGGGLAMDSGLFFSEEEINVTSFPTLFTRDHINLDPESIVLYASLSTQAISGVPVYGNIQLIGPNKTNEEDITLTGSWLIEPDSGTEFTAGDGTTVYFAGEDSTIQEIWGDNTFYNLVATTTDNSAGRDIQFEDGSTTTVTGTFTMQGAEGKVLTLGSIDGTEWTITPTSSSVQYVSVSNSTNTNGTICAGYSTDGGGNTGWNFEVGACHSYPEGVCSSTTNGNWSSGAIWTGTCSGGSGQPIAGDLVQITEGTTVTVDSAQEASNVTINETATLTFASNSTLTLNGTTDTLLVNNGTFTPGSSSTVVFTSETSPTAFFSGDVTFNNLTLSPSITGDVSYLIGSSLNVNGNFTINPTSLGDNTLTVTLGGATTVGGLTDITAETSAASVLDTGSNYDLTSGILSIGVGGTLNANDSIITVESTSPNFESAGTFNPGGSTVIFSSGPNPMIMAAIQGITDFYNLQTNGFIYLILTNPITISGNLSIPSGFLVDNGNQITGNATGTLSVGAGAFLAIDSGLAFGGEETTVTSFPTIFTRENIDLDPESYVYYASESTQVMSGIPIYGNIALMGPNKTNEDNITLTGSWLVEPDIGTEFTAGENTTVYFAGADESEQTIAGDNTFYNLTATTTTNSTGRTILFEDGSTTTVTGTFTVTGEEGKVLTLGPTDVDPWIINPTSVLARYLNVASSTNTNGTIYASYSTDGGGNTGWEFNAGSFNSAPNVPTLDSPIDAAIGQSINPVLKTMATDPDSDDIQYKILLCEDSSMSVNCQTFDQTSTQTGWYGQNANSGAYYTSGSQARYAIQSALELNRTYYWKSYAIDPSGTNTWSSTQGSPYSFTTITDVSTAPIPIIKGNTRVYGGTIIK